MPGGRPSLICSSRQAAGISVAPEGRCDHRYSSSAIWSGNIRTHFMSLRRMSARTASK